MSTSANSTGRPPPLPPRARQPSNLGATFPSAIRDEPATSLPVPVVDETDPNVTTASDTRHINLVTEDDSKSPASVYMTTQTDEKPNWLSSILLFNRKEPLEVAELRKRVEEEEIKRYMTNFQKHVDYLRLPPKQAQPPKSGPRPHPTPTDYRRKKPISTVTLDQPSHTQAPFGVDPNLVELKDKNDVDEKAEEVIGKNKGDEKVLVAVDENEIDWFAYYLAKITYHLSVPYPIPIPSPISTSPEFTVARFKSASTRLYAASRAGPWEMLGVGLGGVVMWDQVDYTLKWMGIYLILMCTSTFLPFLLGSLLYILLKPRLSRQSAQELQERLLAGVKKQEEAERVKAEKKKSKSSKFAESSSDSSSSSSEDENIDLLDKTKDLSEKLSKATTQATQKLQKKGKSKFEKSGGSTGTKIKLIGAWETFQKEHGAQIVLVLNDLADMHEKLINLFSWKRPEASMKAAIGMFIGMFVTYFTPTWIFVKGTQMAIFVVMFFVIPIVARMPAYDPIAWLLGDSATDAEHALELIRKHGLEGKVWKPAQPKPKPKPSKTKSKASISSNSGHGRTPSIITTEPEPSNADTASIAASDEAGRWMDVNEQESGKINRGYKWLETGRQYMQGERSLDLSFLRNEKDWDAVPTDVVAAKRMSIGGIGGGVVLRTKSRGVPYSTDSLTYLAHHNGSPGTLFVSGSGLRFAPFISGKKKEKELAGSTDAVPLDIDPSIIPSAEPIGDDPNVRVDGKEVRIPMAQVSGVGKTQKSTLGVTISSGLEIETLSSGKFAFPFVANRDEAFSRILAQSHRGLERA